jgi:hypothetical protein
VVVSSWRSMSSSPAFAASHRAMPKPVTPRARRSGSHVSSPTRTRSTSFRLATR